MALFHANEDNFKELVLDSTEPVLVDFWATWCGPCQMLAPALEELSQQVKVVKVDVDENPQLAMAFQVSSIPTVVSFRDGKALKKSVGVVPRRKAAGIAEINVIKARDTSVSRAFIVDRCFPIVYNKQKSTDEGGSL